MHVEHGILVQATVGRIFRLDEDVAGWHTRDPDTRAASLAGPLAVCARGPLTPTRGNTVPMPVTRVTLAGLERRPVRARAPSR